MGFRLLRRLPAHLRHPLVLDECRETVRRRLSRREDDFLDLMRRAVFRNERSPYRELLELVGCEEGDLEHMVRREGLEGALRSLLKAGVYLTTDEYKGRRPTVRRGRTIAVDPGRLLNPLAAPDLLSTTSGSRGTATRIPLNLDCIRDRAVNMYLALEARGGAHWRNAVWGMPSFGPLLWFSVCGGPAVKWFATLDPRMPGLHPRYRWGGRAIAWTGRLAGVRMPFFEHVPIDAPVRAAQWMSRTLRAGQVPYYAAQALRALRVLASTFATMEHVSAVISLGGVEIDGRDRSELARPNVSVEGYVDQRRVLQEADLFVTHHGLNSTHEAIFDGVPMVSYPFFWDQPALAEKCQRFGIAVPLTKALRGDVEPRVVHTALERLSDSREAMTTALRRAWAWEEAVIRERPAVHGQILRLLEQRVLSPGDEPEGQD